MRRKSLLLSPVLIAGSLALLASPTLALDRATVQRFLPEPYAVGERDADAPIWPVFKRGVSGDVLIAHVFEYADFAPAPRDEDGTVHRLVALGPSGAFLELLVAREGWFNWLRPRPTFAFTRQSQPLPSNPQETLALSRDVVRARLGLIQEKSQ